VAKKTGKRRLSKPGWCEVVAIGASAGGLLALGQLLGNLDAEFPPILIVQHLDPRHKSQLARLLARKTRKSIKEAEDGEPITAGMIYIGPSDEHLLVAQGRIQLAHSRLIRFSRPSIEQLPLKTTGLRRKRVGFAPQKYNVPFYTKSRE
jgi:two-component system chemotaxis response regulator CheB